MAYQNYSHTADMMKASLPFFDNATRSKVEILSKFLDFMGCINSFGRGSMVACGYEAVSVDIEGLLNGIKPLCDTREREFVDRILNIFNMKRMFEMYNNFMSTMKTMQEATGFSFESGESKDDTDTVTGNFSGFNFDSIFRGDFTGNTDKDMTFKEQETKEKEVQNTEARDSSAQAHTETNSGFSMDNPMFDMMKGMIPSDQMSTFENLRMLFSTMAYDNNSRPDDNKEQKNG